MTSHVTPRPTPDLWAVHARVCTHPDTWTGATPMPSFYLSPTLAIRDRDDAEKVAREIVDPIGVLQDLVYVEIIPVSATDVPTDVWMAVTS